MVQAFANGDFCKRLKTEGRKDFLLELCTGINALCDTTETAVKSVENSLNSMSSGDLSQKMTGNYNGQLADIKTAINRTMDRLSDIVSYVQRSVSAFGEGNFQLPIDADGKQGIFRDLYLSVNDLCDISERGLYELLETLQSFGDGNLAARMSNEYRGHFAEISSAVERVSNGIGGLLDTVQESALDVVVDGKSIADNGDEVVDASKHQVELLRNLTSSISSMLEAATSSAEQAEHSSQLCLPASENTANRQQLAKELSGKIDDINKSTDEIVTALALIEDIAMQTYLLSFNASVEAARGGYGASNAEGFKVVTQKIRALANRSADAANNIRDLTTRVRASVSAGVELVDKTNEALPQINDAISESTLCTNNLSRSSAKQLTICKGIDE